MRKPLPDLGPRSVVCPRCNAPKLPPCPVCGKAPKAEDTIFALPPYRFERRCVQALPSLYHDICAYGRTQAEADARWRRCAGGKK